MKFGIFLRMVGHITEPSGGLGKNATAQATTIAKPTPTTKQEARIKKRGWSIRLTRTTTWNLQGPSEPAIYPKSVIYP